MPRPKSKLAARRVLLRLELRHAEVFDCYTTDQLSQIMAKALDTITPDFAPGIVSPSIIRPKKLTTITIARVSVHGSIVRVLFPEKLEDFRLVARSLLYDWVNPFWARSFKQEKVVCDRAAELCYRILELGIPVQIDYTGVRDKVVSGKFQIEPMHLIKVLTAGVYKGWFCFEWPKGEDYYTKAMSITAAKYSDGRVIAPPERFLEIEDFAETEGFVFSEAARAALDESKKLQEIELLIDVRPIAKRHKKRTKNAVEAVPDHLKDDTP
jgi:hypothetical protein